MKGFTISNQHSDMDVALIHSVISGSYWASDIPIATLEKALANSLVFGIFAETGEQVGFARVITDKATFAYLADVFVLESHRGLGLSKLLMVHIDGHPDLQGLRRFMLATRDAHGLYAQFGFESVENPEILMQRWYPDIYQQSNATE